MIKKFLCLACCGLCMPLHAQKVLLPAVRAAGGKAVGQLTAGQTLKQVSSKAALARWQVQANAPAPAGGKQVLGQAAAWPQGNGFKYQANTVLAGLSSARSPRYTTLLPESTRQLVRLLNDKERLKELCWYMQRKLHDELAPAQNKQQFEASLQELNQLLAENKRWLTGLFSQAVLEPLYRYSQFAQQHNALLLNTVQNFVRKMQWLDAYPQQGRAALKTISSDKAISELAQRLQHEKMIMLGEFHYLDELQAAVADLVIKLKQQNPSRRVVLFTEFMTLPRTRLPINQTADTYFRRVDSPNVPEVDSWQVKEKHYAKKAFLQMLAKQVEVYPLEDFEQFKLLQVETQDHMNSLLSLVHRNKTWARVMENKMAEIRKTDPDALFIVYAGKGHTSWLLPYSLPKFFANEHPAVVELALSRPINSDALFTVWGKKDPFFKPYTTAAVSFWSGPDARTLAENSGFDYLLVVPHKIWPVLKRMYEALRL